MRSDLRVPLFHPVVPEAAIEAMAAVARSGWPGPGPVVEQFETEFARFVGASHAIAVTSGTAALHLAIRLLDLDPGDEVIARPISFVGANEDPLYEGCRVVFADVDPTTGNLEVSSIADRIGARTRAIIMTHYSGTPGALDETYALADRHGIAVIEDAAHACGASYHGARIGSHPGLQTFSFQATKNLTTVDGGMLCVHRDDQAERARRLRWMGIDRDTWSRNRPDAYHWEYRVDEVGHKYAMNDLNAAIGLVQLSLLDQGNERRRALRDRYREGLAGVDGVELLRLEPGRQSSVYLCPILVDRRDVVAEALAERGIETGVHYLRNDRFPIFGHETELPGVESYWTRTLSLPMHLALGDDEVDRVIAALIDVVGGLS